MRYTKQKSISKGKTQSKKTSIQSEQELLPHENLTPIQMRILSHHIVDGKNWKEACLIENVSYSTLNNWLNRPEGESFRKALEIEKQVIYQRLRFMAEEITESCYEILIAWIKQLQSKKTKLSSQEARIVFQVIFQTGNWECIKKMEEDKKREKIVHELEEWIVEEVNKHKNKLELEFNHSN